MQLRRHQHDLSSAAAMLLNPFSALGITLLLLQTLVVLGAAGALGLVAGAAGFQAYRQGRWAVA